MKTLSEDIKTGKFKRVYLLCGEEEYLVKNYKNQLIQAINGGDTMNSNFYEGKGLNVKEIIDVAETMPFMAEYRLVVLEDTEMFKSGGDELAEYVKSIPESTIMLFVESNIDKRSKLYKAVKASGYICEMTSQTEGDLSVWAARLFANAGKRITKANMMYLLQKVGTDMETLSTEIEKLICYCMKTDVVDKDAIDAVCVTQMSVKIFDMIDAISTKNQKKTLDSYYELIAAKEPPMRILYMITRQFNLMLQAKDLSNQGMGKNDVAKAMGVQAFIAGKSIQQARNFQMRELKDGLTESIKTEQLIKRGAMDENIGVEMLLIKYSKKEEKKKRE